jgi:hypothetical protein
MFGKGPNKIPAIRGNHLKIHVVGRHVSVQERREKVH